MRKFTQFSMLIFSFYFINNHFAYCQWEQIETPRAAYITSLGYYNNLVLAGTFHNGLFISNNLGKTWVPSNEGLSSEIIIFSILAYDNYVLLGTSHGIYRSSDSCKSWQKLNLLDFPVYSLCYQKPYIYAGCSSFGLLRSSDNGENWESIPIHNNFSVFSIVTKDNLILVATNKGIFVTSDSGNNWNNITEKNFNDNSVVFSTIIVYENSIFITTAPIGWSPLRHSPTNFFKTEDLGASWRQIITLPNEIEITALAVHSNRIYAATWGKGIFVSSDKGESWSSINVGISVPYISTLLVFNGIIFAGSYIGPFVSSNLGENWNLRNNNLPLLNINSIKIRNQDLFLSTDNCGIWKLNTQTLAWEVLANGLIDPRNSTLILLGKYLFSSHSRFNFETNSWTYLKGHYFNDYTFLDSTLIGASNLEIYFSNDFGANWKSIYTSNLTGRFSLITCKTFLFIGTFPDGFDPVPVELLRTKDTGKTWQKLKIPFSTPINCLTCIDTILIVGTWGEGIYLSSDFGENFIVSNTELEDNFITCFNTSKNIIFAGTKNKGVFASTDFGKKWISINEGLSLLNIQTLSSDGNYLYAGTHQGGLWRRTITEIFSSVEDKKRKELEENQNQSYFINSQGGKIQISLQVDKPSFFNIKLYNILGNEVATLVSEELPPGRYTKEWVTSKYPSGVYFIRFQTDVFTQTRTIMVVK